ncbi:MAG: PAS domain-containing sensor histidine kinase [Acidimicrobiia bacterium]
MSRVRELSEFFENLPVPLYRSDPDGALLAGNLALAQILGFGSMEALRTSTGSVVGFYTDPAARQIWLDKIREQGTVHDFDVELRRPDGQIVWVRDTARAVYADNGETRHFEGCLIDVTDRIRLERSRDQFLATVSHELRTPITAIFGLSAEMQNSYSSFAEDERKEMISLVSREAEEASWLIEDLLVAHRADFADVKFSIDSFNLLDEIRRVADTVDSKFTIVGGEGTVVNADPLRTRQIVRNLLTNAVRYGGSEASIEITQHRDEVRVAVCDSGDPIDEATLEYIFEPFVGNPQHSQSVGLGLWISRRLSELMGGSISYNHDGGRSQFILTLPAG